MDWINHYDSPLGRILIASDGTALTGLWFDDQKYFAQGLSQEYKKADLPIFEQTAKWLDIYFSGSEPDFTPALNIRSTEFRRRVYNILLAIPYGQTMTYGKIAELLNKEPGVGTTSARAVGNAVGHNPISIVVPCHRVLGSDGSLTGYAGGTDRKARLLELER